MVIVTLFNKLSRDDAENLGVSWNNGLRQVCSLFSLYSVLLTPLWLSAGFPQGIRVRD